MFMIYAIMRDGINKISIIPFKIKIYERIYRFPLLILGHKQLKLNSYLSFIRIER